MSSRVNTENLSGSSNPSALDPSEINMFTVEYMASTEPWIFLPEEHLDTTDNPRPEFCFGLGMDTIEQLAEFGAFLNPDQAAAIKVHPEISSIAAKRWIEALCGLQRGTIENEFAYSKEAEFALVRKYTRRDRSRVMCRLQRKD